MKIAKLLSHIGVDSMLYDALRENITLFRDGSDIYGWIPDEELPFPVTRGPLADEEWDIVIVDDIITHQKIISYPHKAKKYVWYCHGTYDIWLGFQQYANEHFNNYAVIFTDYYKYSVVLTWARFLFSSAIIQHIYLPDYNFVSPNHEKNNQVMTVCNDFENVCKIYHGYDNIVKPTIQYLEQTFGERYSHYGFCEFNEPLVHAPHVKGNVKIKTCNNYNVSVHPSGVRSVGFALLECLAAGIPVVTTHKVDIPLSEHEKSILLCFTPDDFQKHVANCVQDAHYSYELGLAGQRMARDIFSREKWISNVVPWLESLI